MIYSLLDAVLGVDVTADGSWVLATCKTHLMLIPTKVNGINGYEKNLGSNRQPARRLELRHEHVIAIGGNVCCFYYFSRSSCA